MTLARRMERLRSSAIRDLLSVTQQPEIISLAGACPHRTPSRSSASGP